MKSKKILVLIIIALIVILFANIMIIKSKKFSKIEKEILTEINNTDDEEKENTEVIILENNIEEQEMDIYSICNNNYVGFYCWNNTITFKD